MFSGEKCAHIPVRHLRVLTVSFSIFNNLLCITLTAGLRRLDEIPLGFDPWLILTNAEGEQRNTNMQMLWHFKTASTKNLDYEDLVIISNSLLL